MRHYRYLKCFTAVLTSAAISFASLAQDNESAKKEGEKPTDPAMTAMRGAVKDGGG